MMVYLSEGELVNLRKYKYSAIDKSLVSKYILQPYWNWLVLRFPTTMAPNLMTLLGFMCIIANLATYVYYSGGDLSLSPTTAVPSWVFFSFAIGLFTYQSLDAIDGKQARRTGTSSPLGQLFDHGVDALNTSLGGILAVVALGIGGGDFWAAVFSLLMAFANFYLTTWEEFHTGTLYLGYFNGPVEGVLIIIACYCWTGIVGPHWWNQKLSAFASAHLGITSGLLPGFLQQWKLNQFFVYGCGLIVIAILIDSLKNVYLQYHSPSSTSSAEQQHRKKSSLPVALLGLLPYLYFAATTTAWCYFSQTAIQGLLLPFFLMLGIVFGNMVGWMIVRHVVEGTFPYFNWGFIWLTMGALASFIRAQPAIALQYAQNIIFFASPATIQSLTQAVQHSWTSHFETKFIWACLIMAVMVHGDFVAGVIDQITAYLDIHCLTIKYPQGQPAKKQARVVSDSGKKDK